MCRSFRSAGIGADYMPSESISATEQDKLWESGGLNVVTPKGFFDVLSIVLESHFAQLIWSATFIY